MWIYMHKYIYIYVYIFVRTITHIHIHMYTYIYFYLGRPIVWADPARRIADLRVCVAVCCSVLQCVAVCCSVLQSRPEGLQTCMCVWHDWFRMCSHLECVVTYTYMNTRISISRTSRDVDRRVRVTWPAWACEVLRMCAMTHLSCSVLQCILRTSYGTTISLQHMRTMQFVAVCCSVLQSFDIYHRCLHLTIYNIYIYILL